MARLRLVDEGRHGDDCKGETAERARRCRLGSDTAGMESTNSSTSTGADVKIGTGVKTVVSASFAFVFVRTSLLYIKAVTPEVFGDGEIEAESGGGKIGPAAAREPVDTEGREAEDRPALLDGKLHVDAEAAVGNVSKEPAGTEKLTAFLR